MSIKEKATYWSTVEVFDYETRQEITSLIATHNDKELNDRFYKELELGTGGLRGIIGAGSNRMNIYNVRKATFALANFLQDKNKDKTKLKVAITYDCRNFSRKFAEAAAEVLASCQICALITKELRPVPSFLHDSPLSMPRRHLHYRQPQSRRIQWIQNIWAHRWPGCAPG